MDGFQHAIVGGGIAGASIAYHLSERTDEPIVLYERGKPASETTRKSMALIGRTGNEIAYSMKGYALNVYNEFLSDPRADPEFHLLGSLGVATTADGTEAFKQSVRGEQKSDHDTLTAGAERTPSEYLPRNDLKRAMINPYLETDPIEGAIYWPKQGYTLPDELAHEFLERAADRGVRIRSQTPVREIAVEDGRVTGVVTDSEHVDVENVICAAGPWNPEVARTVGIDLPIRHTLAPILKLQPKNQLVHMIPHTKHYESRIYFRGCHDGTVYVGYNPNEMTPFEEAEQYTPDDIDDTVPKSIRSKANELIEELYPVLRDADVVDEWVGIRSMTPDGLPIVGWTSVEGFSVAAFNSSGINLSPAVGRMIADQLIDDHPTEYYDELSITRFDGFTDVR